MQLAGSSNLLDDICAYTRRLCPEGRDPAPCYKVARGFYSEGYDRQVHFITRNHPLVVDCSTIWFGPAASTYSNRWSQVEEEVYEAGSSGAAFSWTDRVSTNEGPGSVSFIARWGPDSHSPVLIIPPGLLPSTIDSGDAIAVTGGIAGSDGENFVLYAVVDNNVTHLILLAESMPVSTSFQFNIASQYLNLPSGAHQVALYVIDDVGGISDPPYSWSVTVSGPTDPPAQSARPPPTVPPTPPPPTARALMTASVSEAGDSFLLSGNAGSIDLTAPGDDGFRLLQRPNNQVSVATRITCVGPLAIIAFRASSSQATSYDLGVYASELYFESNWYTTCRSIDQGFRVEGSTRWLYFLSQNHPFVTEASTYWFGHYGDSISTNVWSNVDSDSYYGDVAVAISWQNREIQAGGTDCISMVVRWGPDPVAPVLTLPSNPYVSALTLDSEIALSGTVTGSSGKNFWLYAVPNDNLWDLREVVEMRPIGSGVNLAVTVGQLGMTGGSEKIDFYAIDDAGGISNAISYLFTINAPTPTPSFSALPPETPSDSPTVASTRSPLYARAEMVSYVYPEYSLLMLAGQVSDATVPIFSSHELRFVTESDTSHLSFTPRTMDLGALAIVGFEIVNSGDDDAIYSVGVNAELAVDGVEHSPCYQTEQENGFYAEGSNRLIYFICKNYQLVENADTYWFGPYSLRSQNQWSQTSSSSFSGGYSAMTISWRDRVVEAHRTAWVSFAARWGPEPAAPVLDLQFTLPEFFALDTEIRITGSLIGSSGGLFSLYVTVDGDISHLLPIISVQLTTLAIDLIFTPPELGLAAGLHTLDFIAIDNQGGISNFVSVEVTVNAPTPTESATPPLSATPRLSRTPMNARATMQGTGSNTGPYFYLGASDSYSYLTLAYVTSSSVSGNGVSITTTVTTIGPLAVIVFTATSSRLEEVTYDFGLRVPLLIEGRDDAPCYKTDRGFYAEGVNRMAHFICREYPLVVDVSAYWFGSYADADGYYNQITDSSFTASLSAATFGWQNRKIPASGSDICSMLVRLNPHSRPSPSI
jgi:hypothetical protein